MLYIWSDAKLLLTTETDCSVLLHCVLLMMTLHSLLMNSVNVELSACLSRLSVTLVIVK